jgi:molybdopterin-guanine dinucleotide biosynthesis protein
MLSVQRINNTKVKPVKLQTLDKSMIKGGDMFEELYANIFICAKKKSGKSTVVFNILKKCVGKDTRIVIIAATVHKDPTYKAITEYFEAKGNAVLTYTSIKEDGIDNLSTMIEMLRDPDEVEEEEEKEEEGMPILITDETVRKKRKPRKPKKPKYVAPEIIFVLDDLSTELRYPSVANLLKTNRHYKSKVILSSQYPNDLLPATMMQLDYLLLFGNHTLEKLELMHTRLDLSVPFDVFVKMYQIATHKKFSFLYVDATNEKYRINFNQQFFSKV